MCMCTCACVYVNTKDVNSTVLKTTTNDARITSQMIRQVRTYNGCEWTMNKYKVYYQQCVQQCFETNHNQHAPQHQQINLNEQWKVLRTKFSSLWFRHLDIHLQVYGAMYVFSNWSEGPSLFFLCDCWAKQGTSRRNDNRFDSFSFPPLVLFELLWRQ